MYLPTTIKVALSHLSGCYICDEDPEERRERLRAIALAELDEPSAVRFRKPVQASFDDGRSRESAVEGAAWRSFWFRS